MMTKGYNCTIVRASVFVAYADLVITEFTGQELRRVSDVFVANAPTRVVSSATKRDCTKNPRNVSPPVA